MRYPRKIQSPKIWVIADACTVSSVYMYHALYPPAPRSKGLKRYGVLADRCLTHELKSYFHKKIYVAMMYYLSVYSCVEKKSLDVKRLGT